MKCYYIIILCLSFTSSILAQPWMYNLSKQKGTKDYSFYEIQNAFDNYWKHKAVVKGKGFKQYKRWEYLMESRVSPSGQIPFDIVKNEILNSFSSQAAYETSWSFLGPSEVPNFIGTTDLNGIGRINCIAFHPTDSNIIWVGAPTGGAWKTVNGGLSWATTTDQLASIGISDIVINPDNPDIIYLATGDGDYGSGNIYGIGIIKSVNNGTTWQPTSVSHGLNEFVNFRKILIHPDNSNILLAAGSNGIYRTTDGWNSYSVTQAGHFKDIEFNPSNPSIIYATSFNYAGNARIYKSTDGGVSFTVSMTGMNIIGKVNRIEIAVSPANPSIVYAVCSDASNDGFYGFYKSVNSGTTWTLVYDNSHINLLGREFNGEDIGGQGTYDLAIVASPENANEVYVGGVNIWKSTNAGQSWSLAGFWYEGTSAPYIHADQHTFVYSPHNSGALYSGNDGGIYKTYNKGKSWIDISQGIEIFQVYRMNNKESDQGMIVAGSQDNGTVLKNPDGWQCIIGGDGMECIFDYDDNNIIYGTLYYGDIRKSINGGNSFTGVTPEGDPEGGWITPFIMHPKYSNILYAGYQSVYRSVNGGNSWTELTQFPVSPGDLMVVEIARVNDNIIYSSFRNILYKTTDGGKTWIDISSGLPGSSVTDVAISETDPSELWVTYSGYIVNEKIYHSTDGGQSWSNFSDGLPNLPVNCITYQNNSNSVLYAGMDIGVYYRDASMSEWVKYGNDFPNVIVYDLEILYSQKKLRAGTHGRGIWETGIIEENSQPYVDFNISSPDICLNGTIEFTNYSSESFDSIQWTFGAGSNPSSAKGAGPHIVTYTTPGDKTVTIKGYKGLLNYTETKQGIIKVSSEIDFLTSDLYYVCKGNPVTLFASGGYDLTWSPETFLDTVKGNKVVSDAEENITYTVTARSGICEVQKEIEILVTTNDEICDAVNLNEGYNGFFSNRCAGIEEDEPVPPAGSVADGCQTQDGWCAGEARVDNSIWFKFSAPASGIVSIQTDGFDNQVAVYEADNCTDLLEGNYVFLAANDDYPGKSDYSATISEINGLVPGKTYWVQVDGSYGGVTGTFSITLNYFRLSNNVDETLSYKNESIQIIPNPNDGSFILDYSLTSLEKVDVKIYNTKGQTVFSDQYLPVSLSGKEKFNINLQHGAYIFEVKSNESIVRKKFLVKKR